MVNLNDYKNKIKDFVLTSAKKFTSEKGNANSFGIYCCPWAGWLTTNFNVNKSIKETNNNCPDFEFVEFDILDLTEWEKEYESDAPLYKIDETIFNFNHDMGDEKLNQIFLDYLEPLIIDIKSRTNQQILLQFLDSKYHIVL